MDRTAQLAGSSLLAFVPILFAGVIFAVSFSKVAEPDQAFGGLAEYSSMLLGFQYLLFVQWRSTWCRWLGGGSRSGFVLQPRTASLPTWGSVVLCPSLTASEQQRSVHRCRE